VIWGGVDSDGEEVVVGEFLRWMMGTEARRVETEEANDARLESREMPERFLSHQPISTRCSRRAHNNHGMRHFGNQKYEQGLTGRGNSS
jgi:hypothetical protein